MGREKFNSKLGSVLALAGSAVGLGNIWRFPYMLSEYGGGAFILTYILCIIIVSLPIMLCEFVVGRRSRSSAYCAVKRLDDKSYWKYFGSLVVFIPFATLCYYCVIGGWTLEYLFQSCIGEFSSGNTPETIESEFANLVTMPVKPIVMDAVFLLATAIIIRFGVRKGIEKCSKVMMPLLFVIMALLAVRAMTLPGAEEGIIFLFRPDFSKITPQVCLAAMGQSFYSLSIGMGIMITYASYLSRRTNLGTTAGYTIISDLLFAIIAGCAIIPALFAYDMPTGQGTGLVFKTLPVVFSQMPFGSVIAVVFFFAVALAALTSSMSLFEVPVSWLIEEKQFSRRKACFWVFVSALVVGAFCSLSFGVLSDWTFGGKIFFDALDYTVGNYLMPFAGLIIVLFVGWRMPIRDVLDEMNNREERPLSKWKRRSVQLFIFVVRFVSPAAILAIFISGIV